MQDRGGEADQGPLTPLLRALAGGAPGGLGDAIAAFGDRLGRTVRVDPATGVLTLDEGDEPPDAAGAALLEAAACAVALHVEGRRAGAALEERQRLLDRLSRIQHQIATRLPTQDVLDAITAGASELLDVEVVGLRLVDESDPQWCRMVSACGVDDGMTAAVASSLVGVGVGGKAISEGRLVVERDYQSADDMIAAFCDGGLRTAMAAPVHRAGALIGSLTVATYDASRAFTDAEQDALQAFAGQVSLALNDAAIVRSLEEALAAANHRSLHDHLTGLPNRASLLAALDEMLATPEEGPPLVLFIDLDRFKAVNDSLGHPEGDVVLQIIGRRLRRIAGDSMHLARLAGDEFAIVSRARTSAWGTSLARSVANVVRLPLVGVGRRSAVRLTASLGLAVAEPEERAETLLANADLAMYRAKQQGGNRLVHFDDELRRARLDRIEAERSLLVALSTDQLEVHYQPRIRLVDAVPVGVEALVRWIHPRKGTIPPGDFVPLAEQLGLIRAVDLHVLRQACLDVATWAREAPALAGLGLSVNLSAGSLDDPDLPGAVADALDGAGLDADLLTVEVTETVLLDESEAAHANLDALRALGVRLSLDDFGTGYSSLSYLKRFRVHEVKVDKSFVDGLGVDPESEILVGAIVGLGRALGLDVVAEGIEHQVQLDELMRLGCGDGQGYLFARPAPADKTLRTLVDLLER